MRIIRRARHTWKFIGFLEDSHFPVVKDTYYTFFEDLTGWKRLYYVQVWQDNDENAAKDIQIRALIDSVTHYTSPEHTMNDSTPYYVEVGSEDLPETANIKRLLLSATRILFMRYSYLVGESIQLQFQCTSVPGTNQVFRKRISRSELVIV